MFKRFSILISAIAILGMVLTACGPAATTAAPATAAPATAAPATAAPATAAPATAAPATAAPATVAPAPATAAPTAAATMPPIVTQAPVASYTCTDAIGCVKIGPTDPIHIAYLLVVSGANAALGTDSRNGVEIAIDDAGGKILGHTIKFDGQDGLLHGGWRPGSRHQAGLRPDHHRGHRHVLLERSPCSGTLALQGRLRDDLVFQYRS